MICDEELLRCGVHHLFARCEVNCDHERFAVLMLAREQFAFHLECGRAVRRRLFSARQSLRNLANGFKGDASLHCPFGFTLPMPLTLLLTVFGLPLYSTLLAPDTFTSSWSLAQTSTLAAPVTSTFAFSA